MPENDISWKNIKTLYAFNYEKGGGYELRVGRWVVNGREGEPVLERREWWENNQGTRMQGKQRGLNKGDLYRILTMAPELAQIMGFPLPTHGVPPEKSAPVKNEAKNEGVPQGRF